MYIRRNNIIPRVNCEIVILLLSRQNNNNSGYLLYNRHLIELNFFILFSIVLYLVIFIKISLCNLVDLFQSSQYSVPEYFPLFSSFTF